MNANTRAAIYVLAASIGAVSLVYGWATSNQIEAWMNVLDSLLNLLVIVAPLIALKNLTPDAKPSVDEVVEEPAGD